MTTWRTAGVPLQCGHCGARIAAGEVFRAVWVPHRSRRLVRCAACADVDPPDPPPRGAVCVHGVPIAWTRGECAVCTAADGERDWKQRQAGEP